MRISSTQVKDGAWHRWFAWHPVTSNEGVFLWLTHVERKWDERANFRVIDAYDPGAYEGGWLYRETP